MRQKLSSSLGFSIFKILARIRIKKRCSIAVRLIKKGCMQKRIEPSIGHSDCLWSRIIPRMMSVSSRLEVYIRESTFNPIDSFHLNY